VGGARIGLRRSDPVYLRVLYLAVRPRSVRRSAPGSATSFWQPFNWSHPVCALRAVDDGARIPGGVGQPLRGLGPAGSPTPPAAPVLHAPRSKARSLFRFASVSLLVHE
jgi:hypothetical protein